MNRGGEGGGACDEALDTIESEARAQLRKDEAISDEMTGLYNFRYFQHRLKEEIDRARRYKHRISLVMIDLDHFKQINDNFGHLAGDYVLTVHSRS